MGIFLTVVGIAGWYFILSFFHSLNTPIGMAMGVNFTWFFVIFAVGSVLIAKIGLGK